MPHARREVFKGKACLVPEIRQAGWLFFHRAWPRGLARHAHHDHFEFCYIKHGEVEWSVGKDFYNISAGELFFTKPGEVHGGKNAVLNPCELYWIQVIIPEKFPGISSSKTSQLKNRFLQSSRRHLSVSPETAHSFESILKELRKPDNYSDIIVSGELLNLLVNILRDFKALRPGSLKEKSGKISAITEWICANPENADSIPDLARRIGMGISQFRKHFVEETGFSPSEYCTLQRVKKAEKLLCETNKSITDIAFALGFNSSQYFATVFKRITGMSPHLYRSRNA